MRITLKTQIWIALVAIAAGLILASAMVTSMMRSVDDDLEAIEASARIVTTLHDLGNRFDSARSTLDSLVLSGDSNDRERFVELDREIRRGFQHLVLVERDVQGDAEDVEEIAVLETAYADWHLEIAEPLIRLRGDLPPHFYQAADQFEISLKQVLQPLVDNDRIDASALVSASRSLNVRLAGLGRLLPSHTRLAGWERLVGRANDLLSRAAAGGVPVDIETQAAALAASAHQLTQSVQRDEETLKDRLSEAKQHPALAGFLRVLEQRITAEQTEQIGRLEASRDRLWMFYLSLLMPTVPAILALAVTGYAVYRLQRILIPINQAATALSAGDYSVRVDAQGFLEFDVLQSALNGMAGRLLANQRAAKVLDELRKLLHNARQLDEAYAAIARFGPTLLPGTAGAIYLINPSRTLVESMSSWREDKLLGQMVFGIDDCWSLRSGQLHTHAGGSDGGVACPHLKEQVDKASLCVPLIADDEVLGLLHVCCLDGGTDGGLLEERGNLILTLAELIGRSLGALRTSERLRDQSIRDPLSGLFNRRYLDATFERELNRTRRNADSISCLMIDIDHFKIFNDRFGHAAGDRVIAEFGRLLLANVRDADIVCRYGGEEFVVLLPQAARDNAIRRAERLLTQVRQMHTRIAGAKYGVITASVGVASYPEHGDQPGMLLMAADAALYRAKREGRDRVEVATPKSVENQSATTAERVAIHIDDDGEFSLTPPDQG